MKTKSRNNIKVQTNPIYENNSFNSHYITYNKPLFINMNKDMNNNYKTSTLSTKINTSFLESSFGGSYKNKKINTNIPVKEFELEKNYSNTTANYFINEMNASLNSSEDDNYDYKINETFTPWKSSLYLKEEKEQFTPYLGQKNNEKNINNKNKNIEINIDANKENNNFSNVFNNSKEIITRSSLNLKNHIDEKLSNNSKLINKYQKLPFYQRNFIKSHNSINIHMKKKIYNKKTLPFRRYFNNKKVIIIQSVFRGYVYRIKLYNKLKKLTCITVFYQTINNILLARKKYIFNGWLYLIEVQNKKKKNKNILSKNNEISIFIQGNEYKIQNLIDKNNKLRLQLSELLINNTKLKIDINNYKDIESKYNQLLIQFENLKKTNDNLITENNNLHKEIDSLKNKNKLTINNYSISSQDRIYFKKSETREKNKNDIKKYEICKKINNISILNKKKIIQSRNNSLIKRNAKSVNDLCNNQDLEIYNNLKNLDLSKTGNKFNDKNYKLIIVKKINFIIKKVPKTEKIDTD